MPSTCDLIKNIAEAFEEERDELKREIEQQRARRENDRQTYQRIIDRLAELEKVVAEALDPETFAKLLELSELPDDQKHSLAEVTAAIAQRIENLEFDSVADENSRHIQFEGTFDAVTAAVSDLMRQVHAIYCGGPAVVPWLATIKVPDGTLKCIQGESLEQLQMQVAHAVFPQLTADLESYVRKSIAEKTLVVVESLVRDAEQNPPWRVTVKDQAGALWDFAAYGPETLVQLVVQKFGGDKATQFYQANRSELDKPPAQAPRAADETPRANEQAAQTPTLDEANAAMRAAVAATNAKRDARESG